jgi:predicted Rossmann fold flavoprotein
VNSRASGAAQERADVVVVGAGAAGLWAAEVAASGGRERFGSAFRVVLLEKTARTGTKVLASGGTRCNLTTTLAPDAAATLFGPQAERVLLPALWRLPPSAVRERFHGWGVATVEAPWEKVFPASGRARDVRDALERAARGAAAELWLEAPVATVSRVGTDWEVALSDGRRLRTPRLLLCPGGRSYPRTGTTGDGYRWLRELDLPLVEPVPGLVPLTSPAPWVHELVGIAPQEVEARLQSPTGQVLRRRRRPVVFTHRGLSGPGAMDLSDPVARHAAQASRDAPWQVVLDLLPDLERGELRAQLIAAAGAPGAPRLSRLFGAQIPRRLLAAVAAQAGLEGPDPRAQALDKARRHGLVEALKGLRVPVDGTVGFEQAEVTAGGLALSAVEPTTLAVRGRPGLYVIGELLDVQGPIGGLNFQAAWATAQVAAEHAVASLAP